MSLGSSDYEKLKDLLIENIEGFDFNKEVAWFAVPSRVVWQNLFIFARYFEEIAKENSERKVEY